MRALLYLDLLIALYRRHANRIASFWLTRLKESSPAKRLNLVYLVNGKLPRQFSYRTVLILLCRDCPEF